METWYPHATRKTVFHGAGSYVGGPWRGVLHTTEGGTAGGAMGAYQKTNNGPHFTVSYETGSFQCWQHLPIDQAATALVHVSGTVDTNRLSAVQIEIVGFARAAPTFPEGLLDGLRALMTWIEVQTGIHPTSPSFVPYPASGGLVNGIRMSADQWRTFNGWCGHEHVPGNDHGDPGGINITYLLTRDLGGPDVADIVEVLVDPQNPTGAWVFTKDGGVFCYHGAHYYGSYPGLPAADRNVPRTLNTVTLNAKGGYDLLMVEQPGGPLERYSFP
jgi:hypothetical protein